MQGYKFYKRGWALVNYNINLTGIDDILTEKLMTELRSPCEKFDLASFNAKYGVLDWIALQNWLRSKHLNTICELMFLEVSHIHICNPVRQNTEVWRTSRTMFCHQQGSCKSPNTCVPNFQYPSQRLCVLTLPQWQLGDEVLEVGTTETSGTVS